MISLPLLLDAEEAVEYFEANTIESDALLAYIVGLLSKDGYSNQDIRKTLSIPKAYTVAHLKRVGTSLSEEELTLWHNNLKRITLGHVRAVAGLPLPKRSDLLRELLIKKLSVRDMETLAKGKEAQTDADIRSFETSMEEALGREIKLKFNKATKCGSVTLGFYGLDDLDSIMEGLRSTLKAS